MVEELTAAEFDSAIAGATPVMVDFYADWCGPCRMLAPVIAEVASERPDISVRKVNVDREPSLAVRYGITAIPAVCLFREGELVATSRGYCQKEELLSTLSL